MGDSPPNIDDLRRVGLFGAVSDDVLDFLAKKLVVIRPVAGEAVFREGDPARDLFVVMRGEMEVLKRSQSGVDARVALLGPGDWFGEMSILDVQPRSATVRVLAPSELLKISASALDALYRHDTKAYAIIVLNIARELSRRLRVADGLLADFVINVMGHYIERHRPPAS
ncbi:MAG TPA: cyclic nucleotide-binding domain-containing protein [Polyangiaceae bacterium]|nr:cyclic nucleotide-binding domain-containing protein [Polyangiaceae bacterium]